MEDENKKEEPQTAQANANRKAKYVMIAIAVVIVIAVVAIVLGTGSGDDKTDSGSGSAVSEEVYTPTFKYFVESTDENYAEYMAVVDELMEEYEGRVNFDIVDIIEDPEATKNFPVTSETTPFLIMLNTENNPSAIEMSCTDKDKLIEDIEAALK